MASPTTAVNFLEVVRKSGLLTAEQLDELFGSSVPSDPNQCAAALVKAELLTPYQAKQLLAGKFRGFFLGPYKILKPIGQGGMGAVYLAEHTSLGRKVAVKVLTADKAKDKLTLERFNREARAAAALDHPNIVRLHDISQGAGVHFLVMEYVEGNDLQTLMSQTGPLHFAQAAQYVAQAAAGLQHAHDKGFIHRDIKPANLMLTKDGGIKILDMGLARSFTDAKDNLTALLADGDIAGTVDFLSPEQAMNHPLDERSDLYSLGATFYALVTGHPPFNGTTAQKLMQHQLKDPPSVTKKLNGRVPPALSDVVSKMMAKRPNERYQTAAEVVDALGPWLPAVSTGNIVQDPLTLSEFRVPTTGGVNTPAPKGKLTRVGLKPVWKRPPVLIGAGVGLALLVGGLILAWTLGGAQSPHSGARLTTVPTYGPPQQQVQPPAPKPTPVVGKTPSPRAGGKTLYAVDLAATPTASRTVSPGSAVVLAELGGVALPPGVAFNHWNVGAAAEYSVADFAGARALGMRPTAGIGGVQVHLKCGGAFASLTPGGLLKARVTYALGGTQPGSAFIELRAEPYPKFATVSLPPTGGQWGVADLTFTRPPEFGDYELTIRAGGDRSNVEDTLWVKAVEVIDPTAPAPPVGGAVVYRLDASRVNPFREKATYDSFPPNEHLMKVIPGWMCQVWEKGSDGEFVAERADGKVVFGVAATGGQNAAQIVFRPNEVPGLVLTPGKQYEARVEYKTDRRLNGWASVQTMGEWQKVSGAVLDESIGWRTVAFPVTLPEGKQVQFTFGTPGVGTGHLRVRSFELVDPATVGAGVAPAQPLTAVGRSVAKFEFAAVTPFKKTFQDGGRELDGGVRFADGVTGYCWKKESVAEFRCEATDGGSAIGMTNLNDALSSQIGFGLKPDSVPGGKKYRLRVEYQTRNDATGEVAVQTQTDYRRIGAAKLGNTGGKWATADVAFDVPADVELSAIVENAAVGEGNTLMVRRLEVFEAK
jgi:serine/threonine protein kinase